jgi:hypothetical protein
MSGIMSMLLGAVSSVAVAVDEFFNRVTLLLPGNGTNGAQNNTFLDSSTNNFTITRNGNTTQGTFSPFSQTGWSVFFNNTDFTNIYAASSADFNFGSGDFTIECFFNSSNAMSTATFYRLFDTGQLSCFFFSGNIYLRNAAANELVTVVAHGLSVGVWYHLAFVRSSTTYSIYRNGSLLTSGTGGTVTSASAPFVIGTNTSYNQSLSGYVSDFRVTTGQALYTTTFTPATTALTTTSQSATASNVKLLTCQSNRFVDNSTQSTKTILLGDNGSNLGTRFVQAFSPFAPTAAYSAATVGGSGYFDGTGDYLSTPDNAAFDLGTGDFTFECWLYKPNNNDVSMICSAANGLDFAYVSGSLRMGRYPVAWDVTELYTIPQNAWTHIAFVKASGRTYLFANGTLLNAGGTANTNSYDVTTTLFIGVAGDTTSRILTGYMAGVRLIKGQALATASFTPPTSPVTTSAVGWTGAASSITGTVSLLLNYTNAGITDATAKNVLETAGNAQISTTQSKFGGGSMYFDGNGDFLIPNYPSVTSSAPIHAFGTGDFTIEAWVYSTVAMSGSIIFLFDFRPASVNGAYPSLYFDNTGTIYYTNTGAQITGSVLSANTWTHIAVCRSGTSTRLFINGTQSGSTYTDSTNYISYAQRPVIAGSGFNLGTGMFTGYIDDFRISRVARYTSNFTAPTSSFPLQ